MGAGKHFVDLGGFRASTQQICDPADRFGRLVRGGGRTADTHDRSPCGVDRRGDQRADVPPGVRARRRRLPRARRTRALRRSTCRGGPSPPASPPRCRPGPPSRRAASSSWPRTPAQYQATYGTPASRLRRATSTNSGETVTLNDGGGAIVDSVAYPDAAPWPATPDGAGPSLELVDAGADRTDDPRLGGVHGNPPARRRAPPTRCAVAGLGPRITDVSPSPTAPAANQPVTVTATVTGQTSAPTCATASTSTPSRRVTMTSSGGGTFTATIPGAAAGHLIRYRVAAANACATTLFPRVDDTVVYQGVVVPRAGSPARSRCSSGSSPTPTTTPHRQPDGRHRRARRAIAYNGTVIDNVDDEHQGPRARRRPQGELEVPHPRRATTFDMPGCWPTRSTSSPCRPTGATSRTAGPSCPATPTSAPAWSTSSVPDPHPAQRRRSRAYYNLPGLLRRHLARARGLRRQAVLQGRDQRLRREPTAANVQFSKKAPDDDRLRPVAALLNGVALTGTAQRDYLLGNADIPRADQLRGGHRDHRPRRLVVEELLRPPGPRDRSLVDHPLGPRPHARQRLLRRQQQVRHAGRARRQDQNDADDATCSPCPSGATCTSAG